jgi:hypothetical protein
LLRPSPSSTLRAWQVAHRRRQAPHDQFRIPAPQPRQRQLHLHAALAAHQLVPLVDDDHVEVLELVARAACESSSDRIPAS